MMTELERAELKKELMEELRAEMAANKIRGESSKCLQPVLDEWCNGQNRHGNHGRYGPLIESLPKYRGWTTWEMIRRITCNIMDVSYVRDIWDKERAVRIAGKLCEVVTELAQEEGSRRRKNVNS